MHVRCHSRFEQLDTASETQKGMMLTINTLESEMMIMMMMMKTYDGD